MDKCRRCDDKEGREKEREGEENEKYLKLLITRFIPLGFAVTLLGIILPYLVLGYNFLVLHKASCKPYAPLYGLCLTGI